MNHNRKCAGLALLLLFVSSYLVLPSMATAQSSSASAMPALAVPVTGTFAPSSTTGPLASLGTGTFTGTLNVQQFAMQNGALVAVGTLIGTMPGAAGQVTDIVVSNVAVPVATPTGSSCSVLILTLGPLHLDSLGLVTDLSQVNLNVTAQPGSGNQLGTMLCNVSTLVNGGGAVSNVANQLNQILGALHP